MDRLRKLALIQRSLGLRHKLKVHESLKAADSHEELALMMLAKWEYEDEVRAIEGILTEARLQNVQKKKAVLESEPDDALMKLSKMTAPAYVGLPKDVEEDEEQDEPAPPKKKKK